MRARGRHSASEHHDAPLPAVQRPAETAAGAAYLDELNRQLVAALQTGGEAYVSNAVIEGRQFLRACIVNFRTTAADVDALAKIVVLRGERAPRGANR